MPIKDVTLMEDTARQLAPQSEPVLPSLARKAREYAPRSKTTKLDYGFEIAKAVDAALSDVQIETGFNM
ncbi:hypothetical protein AGMMS49975_22240 [Clostridia bacterium]|nr:hypothetical protein AGMMS49975_22240 [Clostridia bacterium]